MGLVLGIGCSPRAGGNSERALEQVLAGAGESGAAVEKILLRELVFSPCLECARVRRDGSCRVDDDLRRVYGPVLAADALVLAAPVFFGGLCAQGKMMIDRFQCYWLARHVFRTVSPVGPKRPGAFVAVAAGDRRDFFDNAASVVKNFFATVNVEYRAGLFCPGVETRGEILGRADCLAELLELGRGLGRAVQKTRRTGRKAR